MNKKITKTIFLIVFVVFFGINKVYAKDDYETTCVYQYQYSGGDPSNVENIKHTNSTLTIGIKGGYKTVEYIGDNNYSNNFYNWDEDKKDVGFLGYDYFSEHNKTCPPYLVVDYWNVLSSNSYFSDDDKLSYIEKEFNYLTSSSRTYKLTGQTNFKDDDSNSNSNSNIGKITPKTCECSATSGKRVYFKFSVDNSLIEPTVSVLYGNKTSSIKIKNWSSDYEGTGYKYVNDLSKNNSCPSYAYFLENQNLGSDVVLVSDRVHSQAIYYELNSNYHDDDHTIYTLSCKQTSTDVTSNSNPTSTSNDNPDYDEPEVKDVRRLSNGDSVTYSCGSQFITGIPSQLPKFGRFIYNFLLFLVPLLLIILGTIDLVKSIVGGKEDEIKKGQQVFIKRLINGLIVFFTFAFIKLLVSVVFPKSSRVIQCVDCIITDGKNCINEDTGKGNGGS